MTAADCLSAPDAVALLAAIDAGDDSALGPLSDLFEEAGDPRAAALRVILAGGLRPAELSPRYHSRPGTWGWRRHADAEGHARFERLHQRSLDGFRGRWDDGGRAICWYVSRSAALLALAEALAHA